jgi:hypothetical protein
MHLVQSPTVLGSGEAFFTGIDLGQLGFRCTEHVGTAKATHIVLAREGRGA